MSATFVDLPDDALFEIVKHLDSFDSYRSLACVSRTVSVLSKFCKIYLLTCGSFVTL